MARRPTTGSTTGCSCSTATVSSLRTSRDVVLFRSPRRFCVINGVREPSYTSPMSSCAPEDRPVETRQGQHEVQTRPPRYWPPGLIMKTCVDVRSGDSCRSNCLWWFNFPFRGISVKGRLSGGWKTSFIISTHTRLQTSGISDSRPNLSPGLSIVGGAQADPGLCAGPGPVLRSEPGTSTR